MRFAAVFLLATPAAASCGDTMTFTKKASGSNHGSNEYKLFEHKDIPSPWKPITGNANRAISMKVKGDIAPTFQQFAALGNLYGSFSRSAAGGMQVFRTVYGCPAYWGGWNDWNPNSCGSTKNKLNDGNWHTITMVYAASKLQLCIDGKLAATNNNPSSGMGNLEAGPGVYIGARLPQYGNGGSKDGRWGSGGNPVYLKDVNVYSDLGQWCFSDKGAKFVSGGAADFSDACKVEKASAPAPATAAPTTTSPTSAAPTTAAPTSKPWFCVASASRSTVTGPYRLLSEAKTVLNQRTGSSSNRQMICEMQNGVAKSDPHTVGGESQGAGANGGFNKWWWGWGDINGMNRQCNNNNACAQGPQTAAPTTAAPTEAAKTCKTQIYQMMFEGENKRCGGPGGEGWASVGIYGYFYVNGVKTTMEPVEECAYRSQENGATFGVYIDPTNDVRKGCWMVQGKQAVRATYDGLCKETSDWCKDGTPWGVSGSCHNFKLFPKQFDDIAQGYTTKEVCTKAASPSVSGDPFVVDQSGAKVQFFLPLRQEILLLTCEAFELYGAAFGTDIAGDHQQWFDKFRVKVGGKDQLVVSVKRNATETADEADISAPSSKEQPLAILDVEVEGTTMQKSGAVGLDTNSLVAVWHNTAGETVQFSYLSTVLQLKSAVAQKFAAQNKQVLYTHLDLRFVELDASRCSGGILAEIWGTVPMTQATSAMLLPPEI